MPKRAFGSAGFDVSDLALGTWGLSGDAYSPVAESEQDRVIDRAVSLGITLFDTADVYGDGAMESKLGARLPSDGSVRIITKVGTDRKSSPPKKRFDAPFVRESFERSQERLLRDPIDVVLLHNPSAEAVERGEATSVLNELRDANRLRAWGVSAGSTAVARAALAKGARVLLLAYNAFFVEDVHDILGEAKAAGAAVVARSIFAHGLLCGYWTVQKHFSDTDHRRDRWSPEELRRRVSQLEALRALIGGEVYTMRAAALRFVLSNQGLASAVIGPRNAVQLDQLVREAGKGPPYLSEEKLRKLALRLEDVGVRAANRAPTVQVPAADVVVTPSGIGRPVVPPIAGRP